MTAYHADPAPSREDFQKLLAWRIRLRQHNAWLEQEVAKFGLTAQQFQLLVAVKGHPGSDPATVSDLAGYLMLRPHSTIELVNRCSVAGFIQKQRDRLDSRIVRVVLTPAGEACMTSMILPLLVRLRDLSAVLSAVAASETLKTDRNPNL